MQLWINDPLAIGHRKPVAMLFGGETAEKQTSLMSGTNAWLKLRGSRIYEPFPFLLGKGKEVWELPYSYILNHTVEEIIENAKNAKKDSIRLVFLVKKVKLRLALERGDATLRFFLPRKTDLNYLTKKFPFIFLGLHGGIGENGTIQKILSDKKIKYNGSESETSKLCMNKWQTNEIIKNAHIDGVTVAPHVLLGRKDFNKNLKDYWKALLLELRTKTIIAKPRGDGCSAGVVRIFNAKDLATYISLIKHRALIAKAGTFTNQTSNIHMPEELSDIIFESFVETDKLKVAKGKIAYTRKSGYVEMTVGLLEKEGKIKALSPSITIAEQSILSVEEKFQGGTGVNITPPPKEIISSRNLARVKNSVEKVAELLGVRGYARIDVFAQIHTGNIIVIEINTLPGLTPSTVIFHQALAENPPVYPTQLLEKIIKNAKY